MTPRRAASAIALVGALALAREARGDGPAAPAAPAQGGAPQPTEDQIKAAIEADASPKATLSGIPAAEEEAPPPRPRKKGVVVESSLGALAFAGKFRQVAPTALWMHLQAGYEIFSWLMVFGEGELAFTDTSVADDPSKARAFPIFGFGGGARATAHLTERVALFLQGDLGAMKADVPNGAFAFLGYRDAESLGLSLGGRVGVEWYQVDRHIALGLAGGVRDAKGFAKTGGQGDTPLMIDAALSLRYTF